MSSSDLSVVRSMVLIDDDADFLHVLKRRLQAQRTEFAPAGPVDIHTFSDPVEALVNLPAEGICVIIIDYSMPGSTGLDWIPKLIAAGIGPVILLTNQNDVNVTAAAFRAGAADYIAKGDVVSDNQRLGRGVREAVHRYRLEARNSSLTRELKLVNAELEAKNKRLRELTETAHQFVDDVAHDLRTPLTVIDQYASIIADGLSGSVTDLQRDHLGVICEATHDMAEMVDDFLDSSKLKARALAVDRQPHQVADLLGSVSAMLTVRGESKGVCVEQSIAPGVGEFFADLSKAGRVLTNLGVNAIKVTNQKSSIKLWAKAAEGGDVRIGVTDQGPGLTPPDLKVIFERFKQIEEPQLSGEKGFGLGLSIVRQLAWLNLGVIDVQSEVGKGSIFSFTLPANNLPRILACFIESIRLLDQAGDLRLLRVRSQGNGDVSALRHAVASCGYPMDLALLDAEQSGVNVLGVSRDPQAWINRIRPAISRRLGSMGQPAVEPEIQVGGSWARDHDQARLQTTLLEALNGRRCYA